MRTPNEVINELDPTLGTAVTDGHVTPSVQQILDALTAEGYDIVKRPLSPFNERARLKAAFLSYLDPYLGRTINVNNIDNLSGYLSTMLIDDRFFVLSPQDTRTRNTVEIPIPMARRIIAIYEFFVNLNEILDKPLEVDVNELQTAIDTARDR